jgi:hypothetical protein
MKGRRILRESKFKTIMKKYILNFSYTAYMLTVLSLGLATMIALQFPV